MSKTLCLVTGGAGFIGSNLTDALVSKGFRVRVLDNFSSGKLENLENVLRKIDLIKGDLRREKDIQKSVKGVSYIFHMGAIANVPQSVQDPETTHDVNVTGTFKLLCTAKKAKVRRVIFTSSSAIYGETNIFPSTEKQLPMPESPYAASKIMGEYYCKNFSSLYGLETVCLRYFNVYGPRQNPKSRYACVIPIFLKSVLEGEPVQIHWDGLQSRDFVHVSDVVSANILAMTRRGVSGKSFNIGTHYEARVIDCLRGIQETLKLKRVETVYTPKREGDVRRTFADITKAKKLLGFKPKTAFEKGLQETVKWFLVNSDRL